MGDVALTGAISLSLDRDFYTEFVIKVLELLIVELDRINTEVVRTYC
jgi:hypothetical protein